MTPSSKRFAKLRSRLLLGAGALLVVGLLVEWSLAAGDARPAQVPDAAAPQPVAEPAPAPAAEPAALTSSQPAPAPAATAAAEPAAVPDDGPPGIPQENDPIEPELPQTPQWKLQKTAHLHGLLDRHVARLEAERAAAKAAGREEDARRLEVAVARAKHRLQSLQAEMASLRAEAGGDAEQ